MWAAENSLRRVEGTISGTAMGGSLEYVCYGRRTAKRLDKAGEFDQVKRNIGNAISERLIELRRGWIRPGYQTMQPLAQNLAPVKIYLGNIRRAEGHKLGIVAAQPPADLTIHTCNSNHRMERITCQFFANCLNLLICNLDQAVTNTH